MTRLHFVRSRLLAAAPSGQTAILYALSAVVVPTLIRASIDGLVSGTTFVAYFPFVLLSAMFLGWRNAIVVTLASAVIANFLFMEPRYTFFAGSHDTTGAVSFVFSSMLIIALAETLRRTVADVEVGRKHEARLNRELQHRVKNTLAVIQGLATQTFRDPSSEPELRKFQSRLGALASAHDILIRGEWETCSLPELAARALEPFNRDGNINLYGPPCTLREESCVPFVLALHELATNAVKYGALSTRAGSVEIVWTLSPDPSSNREDLVLEWAEGGGPPVQAPIRRGLGSKLLRPQPGIKDVQLTFPARGVSCRFHLTGAKGLPAESETGPLRAPATFYSTALPMSA
jgi:two-component sensor histidine kinase